MSTSSDNPGIALAEELRRQSEQDATVTPMDAVADAARNAQVLGRSLLSTSRSSVDLKRLMYYVYGGWAQGINLNEYPPAVAYLFGKQIYDESTHEMQFCRRNSPATLGAHAKATLRPSLFAIPHRDANWRLYFLPARVGELSAKHSASPRSTSGRRLSSLPGPNALPKVFRMKRYMHSSRASWRKPAAMCSWAGSRSSDSWRKKSMSSWPNGSAPRPVATISSFSKKPHGLSWDGRGKSRRSDSGGGYRLNRPFVY